MKRLTILLFSLTLSFNSYGEWTEISSNVKGDSYHVNLETIQSRNGYVYYWQLDNSLAGLGSGEAFSAKSKMEIDCIEEAMRMKVIHYYTGNMGKGEIYLTDDSPSNVWQYPPPSSAYYYLMTFVCSIAD